MAILRKTGPANADLAVVEIRAVKSVMQANWDKRATQLLAGTFEDAGLDYSKIRKYSLTFPDGNVSLLTARKELLPLLGQHRLVLALGAEPLKLLCDTKKVMDDYQGSLTYHEGMENWILPSYHPSVVYVGPKETLNPRYDKFDCLYDHIHRAADLINGKMEFPAWPHETCTWEWVGHTGSQNEDGTWTGYYEATDEEIRKAKKYFTTWLDFLDSGNTELLPAKVALDTESRDLNIFRDKAFLMLQICDGVDAHAFNAGVVLHPSVKPLVTRFLKHPEIRFIIHNSKYDRQVTRHNFGTDLDNRTICTLAMALGTTEKAKQTSLKYQSRQKLNAPFYEEELGNYKLPDGSVDFSLINPETLAEYGCKDVYYGYELMPILAREIKREGTSASVRDTLNPGQNTFADMEYEGFYVDQEYLKAKSAEWLPRIEGAIKVVQTYAKKKEFPQDPDITGGQDYKDVCDCVPTRARFHLEGLRVNSYGKKIRELTSITVPDCDLCNNKRYITRNDTTLNVNSPKHMQHLCFDILKMKELPSGGRSCDKEFWKFNGNHELSNLVAEYKELQYLRRNFLEGLQRFIAEDGKVHPNFNIFGAKTGRLSVNNPAMQTVPKHSPNAKEVRKAIVADPGCYVIDVDYSSLEMYMAHHLTGDEVLLENLTGEWDVHTALAAKVYMKDPGSIDKKERQSVKSVNFGAGYGISGFKLALDPAMEEATGGDPERAQEFLDTFWGMYKVWAAQCDVWREKALTEFYLTTELGRKRRWNLITADNMNKVKNQAINFPGQSMASDLCLRSLIKVHWGLKERGWGRAILTVHDALVYIVKQEFVHEAVEYIVREMTTPPFETSTPFKVDVEIGLNYGEKEEYDPQKDYNTISA